MSVSLYIARRLQLFAPGRKANTTGMIIAVAGVAIALMVMEITLAVVTGFKHGITDKLMGFEAQVAVQPAYNYDTGSQAAQITLSPELHRVINEVLPDANVSLSYSMPGLLKTDDDFAGVYFSAHDSAHNFDFERNGIVSGEYPDYSSAGTENDIVISEPVARKLNLGVGDKINTCFFINDAVRMRRFVVKGIYETGFEEYDATVAFASLGALQRLVGADNLTGTQIDISGFSLGSTPEAAERLQLRFLDDYREGKLDSVYPVDNVTHTGATYLSWLSLLDTNAIVIFILMLCIAGFTLVSSMFILILDRIPTIGILRAMGATRSRVRSIFIYMAMRVVCAGLVIGNVAGISLLLIQKHLHIVPLDPKMYYFQYVPVEISPLAFIALNAGVAIAAWLILLLPSGLASRISPATTMRFD